MKKVQPLDQETTFRPHELFFSKTDKRGVILSGNAVFVRISQYEKNALIGSAHNIVRHPDMPKTIFHFFWDTIQKSEPIGAYVKNMSRSGCFYWVFAVVWPISDGFLSIRLKPTSGMFGVVQKLYEALLSEETEKGVASALSMLTKAVKDLGFDNYQEFMSTALVNELLSRDKYLAQHGGAELNHQDGSLRGAIERSGAIGNQYGVTFGVLIKFVEMSEVIRKNAEFTARAFRSLGFLSINMAIGAEKAGESGHTLSEVSNGFRKVANDIHEGILEFNKTMNELKQAAMTSQFQIGGARLQIEMIRAFLVEIQNSATNLTQKELTELKENFALLSKLISSSTETVRKVLIDARAKLKQFVARAEELSIAINGLEVIRMSAKIETTKLDAVMISAFHTHIAEMTAFIKDVSKPLKDSRLSASALLGELEEAIDFLRRIQQSTLEMNNIVNTFNFVN